MGKRILLGLLITALFLFLGVPGFAQESAVKGNLVGVILDASGAVVQGATVTLNGSTGTHTAHTDVDGKFTFPLLTPGAYSVKVEKQGFKVADVKGIEVATGRTSSLRMQLEPGAVSETVEVTANAVTVDTASTATGANLSDTFYAAVPVPRNVAGLFYVAPGVSDSGGAGRSNPSISGGSGLENLYVADGVNITDPAFGGLGVFTREYGSVGTGINLSFIKEVQVKTGGFEPQYGQSTGGVVQIVTKSGSPEFHGAIGAYFAPQSTEATYRQRDDFRKINVGNFLHQANYDASGEVAGYVPGFRNNLFFFASYNPTWGYNYYSPALHSRDGLPAVLGSFTFLGGRPIATHVVTHNYAGKLTLKLNDKNTIESSIFGDPSRTDSGPQLGLQPNFTTSEIATIAANNTMYDRWNYGTRNWVLRYNGTLSPTWLVNANFTWNNNKFTDTPVAPGTFLVVDSSTPNLNTTLQGLGFIEDHNANNFAYTIDTQKSVRFAGEHTFLLGFNNQLLNYDNLKFRTGGTYAVPDLGARNVAVYGSACAGGAGDPNCPLGQISNAQFRLRIASSACTLCPLYMAQDNTPRHVFLQQNRGEYGPAFTPVEGTYYAGYLNDSWSINKHFNVNLGLRWEQYQMVGANTRHTFVDNWAPRLGVVWDPAGDRKSKFFANFGRYNYEMPLDAAIRSLSNESDLLDLRWAPPSVGGVVRTNPDGSIPIGSSFFTAANLLNGIPGGTGGAAAVGVSGTGFAPGTRMQYEDEWVGGFEHQFGNNMVVSVRYIDRRLKRIVEDMAAVSPEGAVAGVVQQFLIGNPNKSTDLFHNLIPVVFPTGTTPPASCSFALDPVQDSLGNTVSATQGVCFNPDPRALTSIGAFGGDIGPDGVPDGFVDPVRNYQAAEFELNKSFSRNWLMRFNYRLAYLRGNYEGAFRNDNGQTDPSISSLFDFTPGLFNMLGDQFKIGALNTDRHHVVNAFFSYTFDHSMFKGLTLGTGARVQSGTPISVLADHPVYLNSGEVPIGGRGILGRTPVSASLDLHSDYAWKLSERSRIRVGADFFNVTNSRMITLIDQNRDLSVNIAGSNPDFTTPVTFQRPFYGRFSARWEF